MSEKRTRKVTSKMEEYLVEIKKKYFAMTLKPDGYFTRPGKTAFGSRVSMIADMLKQQ